MGMLVGQLPFGVHSLSMICSYKMVALTTIMFAPGITKKILALSWPGVWPPIFQQLPIIFPGACRWIYFWNLSKLQTLPKIGWAMYVGH